MMFHSLHRQLLPTSMKAKFSAESATDSWQALRVFTQSPKTSKLLFTFILASTCELVFAASYSKSNPLILFLQFWAGAQSGSGSPRQLSFQVFFPPVFEPCLHTDSARLPRACWCLLVQPSCALLYCKYDCDLMMASAKKVAQCILIESVTNILLLVKHWRMFKSEFMNVKIVSTWEWWEKTWG